jgi:Fe-S-cluster containining protein
MARDLTQALPSEPELLRGKRKLAADERFNFACHSGLPCFNRCCSDVNILLTPLDVLRLSRRLGIATTEFLRHQALLPVTAELELPVVMLKMGDEPDKKCSFVGPAGCTVYGDRPWACRMYPVGMAIPPARAGVEPQPVHFLFEDDFCEGHGEDAGWTVTEWRRDQGVDAHEELEAGFRDLVSHPWFIGGRKLDPRRMEMFFMACYDLDKFRSFVFDSTFLERFELEQPLVDQLRTDDMALMRFGFRWLRYALFAEPTMTVRPDAPSSPRQA